MRKEENRGTSFVVEFMRTKVVLVSRINQTYDKIF